MSASSTTSSPVFRAWALNPPDVKNTAWEEINKVRDYLGKSKFDEFDATRDASLSNTVGQLHTFYNNLVTSVKSLELTIPQKKVEDVIGKSYIASFDVRSGPSIAQRPRVVVRRRQHHRPAAAADFRQRPRREILVQGDFADQ